MICWKESRVLPAVSHLQRWILSKRDGSCHAWILESWYRPSSNLGTVPGRIEVFSNVAAYALEGDTSAPHSILIPWPWIALQCKSNPQKPAETSRQKLSNTVELIQSTKRASPNSMYEVPLHIEPNNYQPKPLSLQSSTMTANLGTLLGSPETSANQSWLMNIDWVIIQTQREVTVRTLFVFLYITYVSTLGPSPEGYCRSGDCLPFTTMCERCRKKLTT